jgi:hydrogenase maturation protease
MMASPTPRSETLPQALVLACGNTLRGDDGVGWQIGCAVKQQLPMAGLTILLTQQLLPEHAESVSAADVVVFVDCSATIPAGTVSTVFLYPAPRLSGIFTHHLDPPSLLRLALDLYARSPDRAIAVTVGGESFALKDRLGEAVTAALAEVLEAVRLQLQSANAGARPTVSFDTLLASPQPKNPI